MASKRRICRRKDLRKVEGIESPLITLSLSSSFAVSIMLAVDWIQRLSSNSVWGFDGPHFSLARFLGGHLLVEIISPEQPKCQ